MQINGTGESTAPGLIFLGVAGACKATGVKQQAPVIMTDDNELVWSGPTGIAANVQTATLHGRPVISYWVGTGGAAAGANQAGHGYGRVVILDDTYKEIYSVCPRLNITMPDGVLVECQVDVHESYITPRNTMLVTAYNITQVDLTSIGGPRDEWVFDSLAAEIDIETGEVLFLWDTKNPVYSLAEGSFQKLTDGHYFKGYGIMPYLKEYCGENTRRPGTVVWSAAFATPRQGHSYRAYKQEWHAKPSTPPSLVVKQILDPDELAACAHSSPLRGYVSWNGATDVQAYIVYAGADKERLAKLGTVRKAGFETKFVIPADSEVVQVSAIQRNRDEGRRSNIVCVH